MSKYFCIICLLFVGACAQPEQVKWEPKDRYTSGFVKVEHLQMPGAADSTFMVREYYDSGKLKSTFQYVEGEIDGKAIGFFPSGLPAVFKEYDSGMVHGFDLSYYENGFLRSKFYYENGIRTAGNFFFDNGQPTGHLEFDSLGNIIAGIYYYPNGKLRSQGAFEQGRKTGRWKYHFWDGTVKEEGEYIAGKKTGAWVVRDSATHRTDTVKY